jgi:hypothetical protein
MPSNDSSHSSLSPPSSSSSLLVETQVVGCAILSVHDFVIKLRFQTSLEKEANFLITLGTRVKWSMEDQLTQCKSRMEAVQYRLDRVSKDLDTVVAAAKAKGIDTTPHTQERCLLLRSSVGHSW